MRADPRLANRTALITGGASGFGRGIAETFLANGATVVIADIDGAAADAAARELGPSAAGTQTDITNRASLDAAVAQAEQTYGSLDILVANAGIGQRPTRIEDTTPDLMTRHYDVNASGAVQSAQAALPALRRAGAGASILFTVSGIALTPRPNLYAYGMAKAAAGYFMKSLALDLAPEGIRVNGLFPAIGDTHMLAEFAGGDDSAATKGAFAEALPLGRLVTGQDVGEAALYLATASAITGCALAVDMGRTL